MGELLREQLEEIHSPHIVEVRGLGLMTGVQLDMEAAPIIAKGFEHGVMLLNAGPDVLRLLPPLIAQEDHIRQFTSTLQTIFSEISA
jgi:acetylornithine/succinyldiaminopimelate/putrescine aminotransferase